MSKRIFIFLAFIIIALVACNANNNNNSSLVSIQKITSVELTTLLDSNSTSLKIIDVRPDHEFNLEHIPNSLSLPYDSGHFDTIYSRLNWDKESLIVVVDSYEHRSIDAGQKLIESGFSNVKILESGFNHWKNNK